MYMHTYNVYFCWLILHTHVGTVTHTHTYMYIIPSDKRLRHFGGELSQVNHTVVSGCSEDGAVEKSMY